MSSNGKNKEYQKKRNWLHLVGILLTLVILGGAIVTRLTFWMHEKAASITLSPSGIVFFYFLFFSIYSLIISFPMSFYSSFILEHEYHLSNQTLASWFWEWMKKQLLGFVISTPLILLLYILIWHFPTSWWILGWLGYAIFSLVMGKLFPVLIVPLFYKYSPIADEVLKKRIEALATRFDLKIQNISSLNLSKTTKKANAAFTGFGKTKRVILGDTLLQSFSHDEIETVLAHELGHYKHRDILKQVILSAILSFIGFWLAYQILNSFSYSLGYLGPGDVRSFPLFSLIFFIFGLIMSPAGNTFSRYVENKADEFALDATKNRQSFISAMQKLSDMNLADPNPSLLIEFFLYDHPPVGKRIQMAKQYKL